MSVNCQCVFKYSSCASRSCACAVVVSAFNSFVRTTNEHESPQLEQLNVCLNEAVTLIQWSRIQLEVLVTDTTNGEKFYIIFRTQMVRFAPNCGDDTVIFCITIQILPSLLQKVNFAVRKRPHAELTVAI